MLTTLTDYCNPFLKPRRIPRFHSWVSDTVSGYYLLNMYIDWLVSCNPMYGNGQTIVQSPLYGLSAKAAGVCIWPLEYANYFVTKHCIMPQKRSNKCRIPRASILLVLA